MTSTADRISDLASQAGLSTTATAQTALPTVLRDLRRAILSAFPDVGAAPALPSIADRARQFGADPDAALARLASDDLVHTADGAVSMTYPFSGSPTPHQVRLDGSPPVWAMCAINALGIPLMAGRDGTITSADPHSGGQVRVQRGDGTWRWEPDGTVVLAAAGGGCATAADACCRNVSFYASASHAEAYLRADPGVSGQIWDQATAVDAVGIIFGSLLGRT